MTDQEIEKLANHVALAIIAALERHEKRTAPIERHETPDIPEFKRGPGRPRKTP